MCCWRGGGWLGLAFWRWSAAGEGGPQDHPGAGGGDPGAAFEFADQPVEAGGVGQVCAQLVVEGAGDVVGLGDRGQVVQRSLERVVKASQRSSSSPAARRGPAKDVAVTAPSGIMDLASMPDRVYAWWGAGAGAPR